MKNTLPPHRPVLFTLLMLSVFPTTVRAQLDEPGRSAADAGAGSSATGASDTARTPTRATPASAEALAIQAEVGRLIPAERHYATFAAALIGAAYEQRGFRPLWNAGDLQAGFHRSLAEELKRHALPELMALDPEALVTRITDATVDKRDLAHTIAFCDAALLIRLGAVPTAEIWPDWDHGDTPGSEDRTLATILGDLVVATSMQPFEMTTGMGQLAPKNWIYRELLKAYPEARDAMLKYSGLPQIPSPEQIGPGKPGELYPGAPAIAAHLIDRGYLNMSPDNASLISSMTPELTGALVAFQTDYGLDPDGIFGQGSWGYLNTNAADRYRSITINLHRARLMPAKPGERYLIANLPCAELYLFDANDFHVKTMRIVHGRADKDTHRTKIFRDRMQEVVFGPYWNVPPSIAVKELLPKMQEDWGYLSRNNYEIVTSFGGSTGNRLSPDTLAGVAQGKLLIRQKPGSSNALGYVKFLFPNTFNIYMHDTPSKEFFARANRDHSHGCIRVSKPDELAEWVFAPDGWTLEQVRAKMATDLNKGVAVKGGINVYITYFTTFPRPAAGGRILMAPGRDVYGLDAVDARTLAAVVPWQEAPAAAVTTPSGGQ
jgi:murein L,D-transpeptidase YcbB/YkuD